MHWMGSRRKEQEGTADVKWHLILEQGCSSWDRVYLAALQIHPLSGNCELYFLFLKLIMFIVIVTLHVGIYYSNVN